MSPAAPARRTLERAAPQRAEAPRLRLVGRHTAGARRRLGARLGIVAVLAAVLLAALFHVVLVQGQFALESREALVAKEQRRFDELQLEVAELASPARLEAEAARIGMVAPSATTALTAKVRGSGDDALQPSSSPGDQLAESWSEVKPHLATGP